MNRCKTFSAVLLAAVCAAVCQPALCMTIGLRIAAWTPASCSIIEPSAGSELEERLGGAGKAESDGAGGWIVTLTNDVDSAYLPIEIPDDLGPITIDLNGHNLVGADGEPVIRIVPGGGEGSPTVLTVMTTGGDAVVQGGEGAPAVEVADGTQEGVAFNFGEGVIVRSGIRPEIRNVVAKQRYPWNGLVDITCSVSGIDDAVNELKFAVAAVDIDSGITNVVSHFWVVQDGTNSTDCAVHTNGDYRLLWDARADLGQMICSNMVVRVALEEDDGHEKVQLWENGPYWATTNIGADEPWEGGCYFWWGDIVGYKRENNAWVASDRSSSNFSFSDGNTHTYDKGIGTLKSEGWISADNTLVPEHDAAFKQWGGGWRMPTDQELIDLCDKCDWFWTTRNGIYGYIIRGKDVYSLASIFLPAAGYAGGTSLNSFNTLGNYWSSVPYTINNKSWGLGFMYIVSSSTVSHNVNYDVNRSQGRPIRPVQGFIESAVIIGQVGESVPLLLDTMDSPRIAREVETIAYSARWNGTTDANADVSVTVNGEPFVSGKGEGVETWTPTAAGTYTFQHTTAGSAETLTATFNVERKDIALANVVVDCSDVTYSGSAFTPPIQSVTCGGDALVEGTDYTLSYSDNVNVGTATITLTGTNLYNGTYTTNFTIRPKPLAQGMVEAIGNHPYTGKAQTPKPTVTDAERGVALREDVEYTLSYANNTAIGEGIVTVTGMGNYTGTIARVFVIEPSTGSELEESLGGAGKAESDGEGGWIVTITNDVDSADLPMEIPDNLGNVTIDLNGHDFVGSDGKPAIRIVPGDDDVAPTQLTIINSADGNTVVQGGEGASAIEVADGAQDGVRINIGDGVTVQGGGDGIPAIVGEKKCVVELLDPSAETAKTSIDCTSAFDTAQARLRITVDAFTNAVTVSLNPTLGVNGPALPSGLLGIAESADGALLTSTEVTFPARSSMDDEPQVKTFYLFGLGFATNETFKTSSRVVVFSPTITGDNGVFSAIAPATFTVTETKPVLSGAPDNICLNAKDNYPMTLKVVDSYANLHGADSTGYDIWWKRNTTAGWALLQAGVTANADGEITFNLNYPSSGDFQTSIRVVGPDGLTSDAVTFGATIALPRRALLTTDHDSDPELLRQYLENDGDNLVKIKIVLSNWRNESGADMFAFLEPLDGAEAYISAAKFLTTATDPRSAIRIPNGATESSASVANSSFYVLDGDRDHCDLNFRVILRNKADWNDPDAETVFTDEAEVIEALNVSPTFTSVMMSGGSAFTRGDGTEVQHAYQGLQQTFTWVVNDVDADKPTMKTKWTITDPYGSVATTETLEGNPDTLSYQYNFLQTGVYTILVQLQDKDMNSHAWTSFTFKVNVGDAPRTIFSFPDGSDDRFHFKETAVMTGIDDYFRVGLSAAATDPIGIRITRTRIGADGTLDFSGADSSGTVYVTIPAGQTIGNAGLVNFDALDGTLASRKSSGGFQITATVTNTNLSVDGVPYNQVYASSTARVYVDNVAPEVVVEPAAIGTNGYYQAVVFVDETVKISWDVGDVPADVNNNLTLRWTGLPTNSRYESGSASSPTGTIAFSFAYDGVHIVALSIKDKDGGASETARFMWTIRPAVEARLYRAFNDLPVVIEPGSNDGWIVTITNDIDSADLPIEIPDNIGNVTIDLNGYDLVGGDGQPVVQIVSDEGDGDPTVITIVNSGDDATVKGGDGSSAIVVDEGTQDGVVVNIGEGVIVQSGGDGVPGIIGEIGTNSGVVLPYDLTEAMVGDIAAQPFTGDAVTPVLEIYDSAHDVTLVEGTDYLLAWADNIWPGIAAVTVRGKGNYIGEVTRKFTIGTPVEVTLTVGDYWKATLSELGYDVPTNGTPYSVVAKGLPAGLKLKYNAAWKNKKGKVVIKAKSEWWIEGVPTAALDFITNPPYLVITANSKTVTEPLPIEVLAQEVTVLEDLALGQSVNEQFYLPGVTNGWTVSGLPTGLKYTAKRLTEKLKSGKKTMTVTKALPYSVYGKTTKAGLFTITAKKKRGAYYETMKYRVLVTPATPAPLVFGEELTNITTMAYVPVKWDLLDGGEWDGGHAGRVTLPPVAAVGGKVAKVSGLPSGVKLSGQTIVGTPTKPGTYVVTFTKNVKSGKKTVVKTAQILWTVVANDAKVELGFNKKGGVVESGVVGLKYGDLMAFSATSNATVTASGLPAGIKLVRLDDGGRGATALPGGDGRAASPLAAVWGFEGFTTKAGTYLVTVKAMLNGKTMTQRVALKVDALPAWAKGTYNGVVTGNGEPGTGGSRPVATNGLATITVSAVGKISGKFSENGTNWTISAASYTGYDAAESNYSATVTAKYSWKVKSGKKTVTKTLTREFVLSVGQGTFGGVATLSETDGPTIEAWQNLWGSTYKALGKKLFTTKSGKKTLAYKTFAVDVYINDVGAVTFIQKGEEVDKTGLTYFITLSLKLTTAGVATATLSFDTGKKKKDPKTKKMVEVIYKPTCSTVVIPTSAPDADPFTSGVCVYFAPSAANNFTGFCGWVPLTGRP